MRLRNVGGGTHEFVQSTVKAIGDVESIRIPRQMLATYSMREMEQNVTVLSWVNYQVRGNYSFRGT